MTQATLLDVVRRCLDDQDIGWDDNFYTAGGDSIVALQVIAEAAQVGLQVDLLGLLTCDSLRDVAAGDTPASPLVLSTVVDHISPPAGAERAWPASALQVGLIYLSELGAEAGAYLDFAGVRVRVPFHPDALRAALGRLSAYHPVLRSSFDLASFSTGVQIVWPSVEPDLVVHEATADEAADEVIAAWRRRVLAEGIDWERAPAWRCHVVAGPDHFWLSLAMHHSFIDGWSYLRLLTDLLTCYDAGLRGASADLPPQPAHGHERFVALERDTVRDEAAVRFWAERARPAPLVRQGDPRALADPGQTMSRTIGADRFERLKSAADALRLPVKSLCLAAHGWAVGRWSGRAEVSTGLVTNGRPEIDGAERLAGLFLNTIPVRLRSDRGWPDLARQAFEAEHEVAAYRRFPLERIEAMGGRPAFDVTFNFTHFHLIRELDRLERVRVDRWWSRDRATFPVMVDVHVADPEHGTGVTIAFDPALVPPRRAADLLALLDSALEEVAGA